MLISNAYAQVAGATDPTTGFMAFLPFLLVTAALWFVMVRPQMKKAKEHRKLLAELQKGDEVVTGAGITGRISKIGDNYTTLEIATGVEIQVQKHAIATVLPKGTLKHI